MSCDIAVVGGGPAGLSAALQGRSRGKDVLVVSAPLDDIPLFKAPRIDNYPGLPHISGRALLEAFTRQAEEAGVRFLRGRVLNIMPMGQSFYLGIGADVEEARAVVLATGAVQPSPYPGEAAFLGRGVSYCATCDGMLYRGRPVAVVGRSAQAPEEANYLQRIGCQVTYVAPRRPEGLDSAIPFVKEDHLALRGGAQVTALVSGGVEIPCACVFLLRPAMAMADLLPGLALEEGYLVTGPGMETSLPGVFAAGDCAGLPLQIAKAVGQGLVAGMSAADYIDSGGAAAG